MTQSEHSPSAKVVGTEPIIGIIIPAFRCERFIAATLESLRSQTISCWECIVVDDGSPDATVDVVCEFAALDSRIRLVRQENAGVAAARNAGLALLAPAAEFVVCMDSDDIYEPTALETLQRELEKYPQAVAVHGLADFIDEDGRSLSPGEFESLGRNRITTIGGRIRPLPTSEPTTFRSSVTSSTIFPPGLLLMRRSAMESVGRYDETIIPADDWDYIIRLCRLGDIRFCNQIVLRYRRHGSNLGAGASVPEMCRRVVCKTYFSTLNTAAQQIIVRECWRAQQLFLMRMRMRKAIVFLRHWEVLKCAAELARIPFIAVRYARGYPTARGW